LQCGAPNNPGPDSSSNSSKHQIPQVERNTCRKNGHHSDEEIAYFHTPTSAEGNLPLQNVAEVKKDLHQAFPVHPFPGS